MKRKKEPFTPLKEGQVTMYVCGVTVYDLSHIGHARALVVFDVIYRYFKYRGYEVTYVRNYTDVDDKIINRANEKKVSFKEIAEYYIKEFDKDMAALGIKQPTHSPRATDHIQEMIAMVKTLIEKGHAYAVDGDVYFDVAQCPAYGKLSGKNLTELCAGTRVEIDKKKKNPLDFALWKKSKPSEPFWQSPWGEGRPGWHIECSVMSQKHLGKTFDIHGGGMDLIFPHHENEIAQAECTTGEMFARYWVHNGFVNIDQQKMSKSLKNFFTIREILANFHPEVIRLFLLSNHYRSPVDFSEQHLKEARTGLDRFYALLKDLQQEPAVSKGKKKEMSPAEQGIHQEIQSLPEKFKNAMDDDFNTAAALGHVHTLTRSLNGLLDREKKNPSYTIAPETVQLALQYLREIGNVLGLFQEPPTQYFKKLMDKKLTQLTITEEEIEKLIKDRKAARQAKDWQKADAIRSRLAQQGIILKDSPQGTSWAIENDETLD